MKTTLRYNTIESLQQQPAWKKFIDTLVDDCNVLYDNNLISDTNSTKEGLHIDKIKLSESKAELQPNYATLNYKEDLMHLNLRENVSLRGLLRLLSLYKCKIKDIELQDSVLPHTYKVESEKKDSAVWGFDNKNKTYDHETRGINNVVQGYYYNGEFYYDNEHTNKINLEAGVYYEDLSNSTVYQYDNGLLSVVQVDELVQEYMDGDVTTDYIEYLTDKNYEEEDTSFKYIYNVYGYNQKHPILSVSPIKEVKDYYEFEKIDTSTPAGTPKFLYVLEENLSEDEDGVFVLANTIYYSGDDENSGIEICSDTMLKVQDPTSQEEKYLTINEILNTYYTKGDIVQKWVYNGVSTSYLYETSYIINDNDKIDMKKDGRIKYNHPDYALNEYSLNNKKQITFALTQDSNLEKVDFVKIRTIGTKETPGQGNYYVQLKYIMYQDSKYHRYWVVMDDIQTYNNNSILFLKNQLFADECKLKAQPVFLYRDDTNGVTASLCANFLDNYGGIGKITYEVERYRTDSIKSTYTAKTNILEEPPLIDTVSGNENPNVVKGVYYGDWFYKWEQYKMQLNENKSNSDKGFFLKNVYTTINFDSVPQPGSISLNSMYYFFDGDGKRYLLDKDDWSNNEIKKDEFRGWVFENTFKEEFIETMYFNHFVKIYPITKYDTDDVVATTLLYCDNLELVEFGNIIPYVVSFDRIGEMNTDEGSEEEFNDLDCSVFSKILSYNKNTHLVTVNNPVYFKDSKTPKYAVVAYQNASPFNKIQSLNIVAPSQEVKSIVDDLLVDYENVSCALNVFTETEYDNHLDDIYTDNIRSNNEMVKNSYLNTLRMKSGDNRVLYGTYNAQADKNDTPLVIEVIMNPAGNAELTATKTNGTFEFVLNEGSVRSVKRFKENCAGLVTSLSFGNKVTNQCIGGGFFSNLTSLYVIDNFKPKTFEAGNNTLLFDYGFYGLTNLLYYSPETLKARCYSTSSTGKCPMFRGTNLQTVDFGDITWDFQDTIIDINLDLMFENCKCLETVKFKLKNGNKFRVISAKQAFRNCEMLRYIDLTDLDFSLVKDTSSMFEGCKRLERIDADWGINTVENKSMSMMFKDCNKLQEYGNFDKWSGNVATDKTFMNCTSLKSVILPKTLKISRTYYLADMFYNCGAEIIGANMLSYREGNVYGISNRILDLNMPNLKTIEYCNQWFDWRTDSSTINIWIETPELTRESFLEFIKKQFLKDEEYDYWVENGFNVYVTMPLFKKLIVGVDINPIMVDNNGEVICCELINHSNKENIKLYPNKEIVTPTVSIKSNVTNTIYKKGIETINSMTLTLNTKKTRNPISSLVVYANDEAVHSFDPSQIAEGGIFTYQFGEISDTTEIKAIIQDNMGISITSNKLKYTFNDPFYIDLIPVTGAIRINSAIWSCPAPGDITAQSVSALHKEYYNINGSATYSTLSGKVPLYAFPKEKHPQGVKDILNTAYGHNLEELTQYWDYTELTIDGIDYYVYYGKNNREAGAFVNFIFK